MDEREQYIEDVAEGVRRAMDEQAREFGKGLWEGLCLGILVFVLLTAVVLLLLIGGSG